MLAAIHDQADRAAIMAAERAFLQAALDGSCETPIAALAELQTATIDATAGRSACAPMAPRPFKTMMVVTILIEDGAKAAGQAMAAQPLEQMRVKGFFDWRVELNPVQASCPISAPLAPPGQGVRLPRAASSRVIRSPAFS